MRKVNPLARAQVQNEPLRRRASVALGLEECASAQSEPLSRRASIKRRVEMGEASPGEVEWTRRTLEKEEVGDECWRRKWVNEYWRWRRWVNDHCRRRRWVDLLEKEEVDE